MATPPAKTVKPEMQVNIHGIPPKPHMEEPSPPIDEQGLSANTRAEMEAGRKALEMNKARLEAEYEAGRRAVKEAEARLMKKKED